MRNVLRVQILKPVKQRISFAGILQQSCESENQENLTLSALISLLDT